MCIVWSSVADSGPTQKKSSLLQHDQRKKEEDGRGVDKLSAILLFVRVATIR